VSLVFADDVCDASHDHRGKEPAEDNLEPAVAAQKLRRNERADDTMHPSSVANGRRTGIRLPAICLAKIDELKTIL